MYRQEGLWEFRGHNTNVGRLGGLTKTDEYIRRVGRPVWNDDAFKTLLKQLQYRGFGWLRPEGVRKKLEEMTANWQGPPALPGIPNPDART